MRTRTEAIRMSRLIPTSPLPISSSTSGPWRRDRRAWRGLGRGLRLLLGGVNEGLRDETRPDGLRRVVDGVDLHLLDVDDPGEAAHPVEEQREVVVGPVE